MSFDWFSFATGFAAGLPAAILFFVGLALGLRKALSSDTPAVWMLLSFVLRSALLLAVALYLIRIGEPLLTMAGFVLAFITVRLIAVHWARRGGHEHKEREFPCN